MKHSQSTSRRNKALAGAALLVALSAASPTLSRAQDFGGPPPPPQQGGIGMGRGMMPPRGGFGMMDRKTTAANAPVAAWAGALNLTSAQQSQIAAIQAQARPARPGGFGGPNSNSSGSGMRAMNSGMDGPGDGGGFNGGGPPPPPQGGMGMGMGGGAMMEQRDTAASTKISALLTAGQRAKLPAVLQQMDDLRAAGLSPGLYGKLNLTDDQKAKLSSLAAQSRAQMKSLMASTTNSSGSDSDRGDMRLAMAGLRSARAKTRAAAYALLSPAQLALAKSAEQDHNNSGGPGGPNDMGGTPPIPGGPGGGPDGGPGSGDQGMGTPPDNGGDDAAPGN